MKGRLLIVDDEAEIRELLQRHFRYLGYDVDVADGGQAALRILAEKPFDVVVSDVRMPEMDGVELLEAVRREYPTVRIVMMTGYVSQESILKCMRKGAETCVFKPFDDLSILERGVSAAMSTIRHWRAILTELQTMKPRAHEGGTV